MGSKVLRMGPGQLKLWVKVRLRLNPLNLLLRLVPRWPRLGWSLPGLRSAWGLLWLL